MRIRIAAQNLQHGARADEAGHIEDRWPRLLHRLRPIEPDVLLLNEVRGWTAQGHQLLARAQKDLGMYAAPMPYSGSGLPSLILFRPDTMGFWDRCNNDLSGQTTHGFTVASFTIPEAGLPPITFAAGHLNPYSPDQAVIEAALIATRAYRYGSLAVVGGDMNYPPIGGPDPDYTVMRPYNRAARTLLGEDGIRRPNLLIAQAFADRDYVDAAWHLYQDAGDEALLRRTASDDRIDRILASIPLAPALGNYQLLDQPEGASDHHGVTVDIDTERIDRDLASRWIYG